MTATAAAELANEVASAHHASTLAEAEQVTLSFSSGGLAFAVKGQPHALTRVEARMHPHRQHLMLTGRSPRPWTVNIQDGDDLKARLGSTSRRLRWQPEDLGTFAAAAIWTYVTMPILVARVGRSERLPDRAGLRRLRITLPRTLAGHSVTQTLFIGQDGLIRRHDYTATAFGRWARAAQAVADYKSFQGVPIGTTRRVTPRLVQALAGPTLVWIDIHSVELT